MKKALSILLSVLLLIGTCTVLTSVIASAATVTAEAGGSATVDGNTFVATPYYGNSFKGWYDSADQLVSTNPTFTSDTHSELTAKFNVYNLVVDGNFESGTNDFITTADPDSFFVADQLPRTLEVVDAPAGSDVTVHGNKVLSAKFTSPVTLANAWYYTRALVAVPVTIKPNTSYVLSYSMYLNLAASEHTMMRLSDSVSWTADNMPLAEWSAYTYPESSAPGVDNTGWKYYAGTNSIFNPGEYINAACYSPKTWQVNHGYIKTGDQASAPFNGADSVTAYIIIGTEGNVLDELSHIYLDNICFAEETATAPASNISATAEAGGMVTLAGGVAAPVAIYKISAPYTYNPADFETPHYADIYMDPYAASAKAYYGNSFNGWFDGDTLVSTDASIALASGQNLTAKFNSINQIVDGDFDSGTGLASWLSNTHSANANPTGATGLTGNGINVTVGGNSLMATTLPVTVNKNTDYRWQFNFRINNWQFNSAAAEHSVISPMVSETGGWGSWPKLGSWKVTIRSLVDGAVYTLVGSEEAMDEQINFEDLLNVFDENEWLEFTLEFNTGDYMAADTMTYHMVMGFNNATGTSVDFDNVSFYEANDVNCVNFINKENVRAVPLQVGNAITGNNYSFILEKDANVDVTSVKYDGAEVTPVNGVYTITLTNERDVTIELANDADYPDAGKDFNGFDLTTYNNAAYTAPVWKGDTVYHEAVYVYNGKTEATLLYPIDKIVSVRSYDLSTYFVKGVDFDVVDGKLTIPAGSRMLASPFSTLLPTTNVETNNFVSDDDGVFVTQFSKNTGNNNAFVVTYTHTETWDDKNETGYTAIEQKSVEDDLDVFAKLRNGEDVHLVFYGDSMTSGWSASAGMTDVYDSDNATLVSAGYYSAPYTPNWMTMFVDGLKAEYPNANITWENLSLGGKDAAWGAENFAARYELLNNKDVDLFLVGFGINDCTAGVPVADYKANTNSIIDAIKSKNANASVLLYGANSTNLYAKDYNKDTLLGYETALTELTTELDNVAATKLTSIFMDVNASKEPCDYLENNLNHANDFGSRIYAQVMLSAMKIKYTSTAATPAAPTEESKTDNSVTLVATNGYEYSIDGQNWQTSNVFTGLTGNTEYSFYQRVARTEDTYESAASDATKITTEYTVTTAPAAPVVQSKTDTTVVLVAELGCEYSIDGQNWQTSNVFTGLDANTEYTFYQRLAATNTSLASPASQGTKETTDLPTPAAPTAAPEVESKTETTVTLKKTEGYEYSLDGNTWQTSNIFTGLTAGSTYTFYQRVAATDTANASASSAGTTATTTAAPAQDSGAGAGTGTGTGTSTGTDTSTSTGTGTTTETPAGTTTTTPTVPQTGDTNTVFVFAIVFVMALAGVAVSVLAMKKSKAR